MLALSGSCRSARQMRPGRRRAVSCVARVLPNETAEMAQERRLRESMQVEERVIHVETAAQYDQAMAQAGNKLLVVEVESEAVCQTGFDEPELQWRGDERKVLEPCIAAKHSFARISRECPDVVFLSVDADADSAVPLMDRLGIDCLPTVQFWRSGRKLWEHRGVAAMEQGMGEGVLFYGDTAGGGVKASDYIQDLHSAEELQRFVTPQAGEDDKMLTVVDVSLEGAAGCVRVFPAVLALARSFQGFAKFGRLMGDSGPEMQTLMARLNILEAPTFLFYKHGEEVARHVGSSRGDLIGRILEVQAAFGVAPPPPPPQASRTRKAARTR